MTLDENLSQEDIRQYYEHIYSGTSRSDYGRARNRVADNLKKMPITAGEKILDVGCGTGTTCFYLKELGAEPIGIDIALEAIRTEAHLSKDSMFIKPMRSIYPSPITRLMVLPSWVLWSISLIPTKP